MNIKTKTNRLNHIKGKYSMPNKNCILTINNRKIIENIKPKKSGFSKSKSKSKKTVKARNNKSFILRPKNRNENLDLNFKIVTFRSTSKNKKPINLDSKQFLKIERKNPFHARIKSLQINYKDKNLFYYPQTKKNNNKEKININIKKNNINNIHHKFEEGHNLNSFSNKNIFNKKGNSAFEDNEENNSTKNTRIIEQKDLNIDNYNNNNKLLILGNKNKNIRCIKINKKKDIDNKTIIIQDNRIVNDSYRYQNKVLSKSRKNKGKKNSTSKDKEKRENLSLVDIKLKNEKKEENNKKIMSIIQKIKNKLHLMQASLKENNWNTTNNSNKDISFSKGRKTLPSQKSDINSIKIKKINKKKFKNKINLSPKPKSPINLIKNDKKVLNEIKNYDNSYSLIPIKDKKNNFKKKIKNYNKSKRNKYPLFKDRNNMDNTSLYNNYTFHKINKIQKPYFRGTRSQNDIFANVIDKTLSSEEGIKIKTIYKKEKNPKDLAKKEIEKIESICLKGYAGRENEKVNQDNFFIYKNFINNPKYIFTGVCDGHGTFGHDVSAYLVFNIPLIINDLLIRNNYKNLSDKNIPGLIQLLTNTFIQIDKNISKETDIDTLFSGSTCVSLIFTPSKILCANVGDSRCIVGKFDGKKWFVKNLSSDHKPDNKLEKERILKCGGRVEAYTDENGGFYGPQRVWLKKEDLPGLAMSRSFGDVVAHSVGVIPEPEILKHSILEEDKFIILASDGIWEFISSEECVEIVKDFYIDRDINGAINYLYKEASKRWILKEDVIDDITLIIIFLK